MTKSNSKTWKEIEEEFENFIPWTPKYLTPEDADRMDKELKPFISKVVSEAEKRSYNLALEEVEKVVTDRLSLSHYSKELIIKALKALKK